MAKVWRWLIDWYDVDIALLYRFLLSAFVCTEISHVQWNKLTSVQTKQTEIRLFKKMRITSTKHAHNICDYSAFWQWKWFFKFFFSTKISKTMHKLQHISHQQNQSLKRLIYGVPNRLIITHGLILNRFVKEFLSLPHLNIVKLVKKVKISANVLWF